MQSTIRARARNIHRIAHIISYIAWIIQSQRDNIVPVSTVSTRLVLAARPTLHRLSVEIVLFSQISK